VSDPTEPRPRQPAAEACPCCGKDAAPADRAACAICKRHVCFGCLRRYGHHMLACDDCRIAEW
jgi:hypothetical protein